MNLGLDPQALDKQKRTCLHHAAPSGSTKALGRLLEEGLNPTQLDIDCWTPLHWAARSGREASVKLLLSADADRGPSNDFPSKSTPESLALCHGHFKVAKLLSVVREAFPQRHGSPRSENISPLTLQQFSNTEEKRCRP